MTEGLTQDKKSLKTVLGKTANFNEIAKDCVAFANARGGRLFIGIEDNDDGPPIDQLIPQELPDRIVRRVNELTINVGVHAEKYTHDNGGEYIILTILRSQSAIAATSNGTYFIRDEDKSRPVQPDELERLFVDRPSYCWETKVSLKYNWEDCDRDKLENFISDIRHSDRVSSFVKEKSTLELLEYYSMITESGYMTNLGVLWLGKQDQRARLLYSPVIQYIKYDNEENKVQKIVWDDYSLNPKELLETIWKSIPDWQEVNEISDGLWRKEIPAYNEKVVREVICNALVHRPYTTRGDIFINIYPDKMVVVNPGLFPLGISSDNILQKTNKRNEHLARIFYALHLMEAEGSGYDLMYETLLSAGKAIPEPFEGNDYIQVTIRRKIINKEAARLCEFVTDNYSNISRKAIIAFGIILQQSLISASELSRQLQIPDSDRLRSYIGKLSDEGIIASKGKGKGTKYYISPELISNAKSNIPTSLKTIEPYRLKALIKEDLRFHPLSMVAEISNRLPDVDLNEIRANIRKMALDGELITEGGRKFRKYSLPESFL